MGVTRRTTHIAILLALFGLVRPLGAAETRPVAPDVIQAEQHRVEVMAEAASKTVAVFDVGSEGGGGSAVLISPDGYALTNYHVVMPVGMHLRCGLSDGKLYDAVVVGVDPTGDVALIKLLGRDDFPYAELADSDQVRPGDWCFAAGNPFLLATDFQPTITFGLISGVHRYQYPSGTLLEYTDCLQTDAAINPGNSGGPLFNMEGELIGINGRCSFEKRGRVNVGVGYAVSSNQLRNFLGHLESGRIVDHATLGATASTDDDGRVVVTNILHGSDAYRRGLRYGDQIVSFAGRLITSANDLKNILGIFPRGWRVPLVVQRDGQRIEMTVRLAGVHAAEELLEKIGADDLIEQAEKEVEAAPDAVTPYLEVRRGYANYYFNRLHQERLWEALKRSTHLAGRGQPWELHGTDDQQRPFSATIGDQQVTAQWGGLDWTVHLDQTPQEQLLPDGSGGMLWALHQWRQMLVLGPEDFGGEVYYLGTEPLPPGSQMVDVLVAIYDTLETRFLFDHQTHQLVAVELYPSSDQDPCQLLLRDYQARGDVQMPSRMEVRVGDRVFTQLQIESAIVPPAGAGQELGQEPAG